LHPRVAIIGAGAAGCFASIRIKQLMPEAEVHVFEAGRQALAKVAVTGGGRCNLTNSFALVKDLKDVYPRGCQVLKKAFKQFDHNDLYNWFESHGVDLVTQDDQCVFPRSQDAKEIVHTLLRLMNRSGVALFCNYRIVAVKASENGSGWTVEPDGMAELLYDRVLVTVGGKSRGNLQTMLPDGLAITETLPSLFTFNIVEESLKTLMGQVVEDALVSIPGTSFKACGALLMTDWGVSGPAVLKLSSYAARWLKENDYRCGLGISWLGSANNAFILGILDGLKRCNPKKLVVSVAPQGLSLRVWKHIVERSGLREDIRWAETGSKGLARLANTLSFDEYHISGRCRFREEFVTCGGVDLSGINSHSLESKNFPGLYFAGEVLDIDAVTGGFNLQAAWTSGWIAACSICASFA